MKVEIPLEINIPDSQLKLICLEFLKKHYKLNYSKWVDDDGFFEEQTYDRKGKELETKKRKATVQEISAQIIINDLKR